MKRTILICVALITALAALAGSTDSTTSVAPQRRRINPINTAATATQPVNQTATDTARVNAARRARSTHYHDEQGNIIWVDTVSGQEWRDSTLMQQIPKMKYPLIYRASASVDLWDPLMRALGNDYGLIGFSASLNMHNRYLPTFEIGLGQADATPDDGNFTYNSPLSVYFKIGADYNFFYNSNPDYMLFAGIRYGFSAYSFSVTNITLDSPYWQETAHPYVPSQNVTTGWFEMLLGLRVKLWGPISAGWAIRYHSRLHETSCRYGEPWYIPGFGTRSSSIGASITITYTLDLNKSDESPVIIVDNN